MKKNLIYGILLAGITFGMIACDKKKDETNDPGSNNSSIIGTWDFSKGNQKEYRNDSLKEDMTVTAPIPDSLSEDIPSYIIFQDSLEIDVFIVNGTEYRDSSKYTSYSNNQLIYNDPNGNNDTTNVVISGSKLTFSYDESYNNNGTKFRYTGAFDFTKR